MKKFALAIALVSFILVAYGQHGPAKGDYFLLLKNQRTISVNTYKNDQLVEHTTHTINKDMIYATDGASAVALLDTAKNDLLIFDINTLNEIRLTVPYALKTKTVFLIQGSVFIGGEMISEMLVQYHIAKDEWYALEIPEEVSLPGKAIDDIVVNENLLIAIDNLVMPKYILCYKFSSTGSLTLSHSTMLKSNGPYESIYQGRITNKYFGLRSGTYSGDTGASGHISIYDGIDLKRSFAITSGMDDKGYHTFSDFVIVEDKIVVASKEKGLGIFEIKPNYFKDTDDYGMVKFNNQVSASRIRYRKLKNGNIKKLVVIPGTTSVVLTVENNWGSIRQEIIQI
ncbi:hypothetical protein [Parapedobacter lycopersici]|uniref:hypothetical protein n=1 Tax=Parapedobacter lycopersici TaxID=1864939 RepID=UPI00214D6B78|nr:hypothetical protein [Parapedobacter lycopersici]